MLSFYYTGLMKIYAIVDMRPLNVIQTFDIYLQVETAPL